MLDKKHVEQEMEHDPTAERNREPTDPENPENAMNVDEDVEEEEQEAGEDFDEDELVDDEFGPQEFSALNNQLDQLQSALDSLESRNDDIHFKLLELLRSNREIRQGMTEENSRKRDAGCESNPGSSSSGAGSSASLVRNDSTSSSSTAGGSSIGKDLPKTE